MVAWVACGGAARPPSGGPRPQARTHPCSPSSVVTTVECPSRTPPASNASSNWGCKSDADCTQGKAGRCTRNPSYGGSSRSTGVPVSALPKRTNLLAEAPPPPPETVCTYDACTHNSDCGTAQRCVCDPLPARYRCERLDECLLDAECPQGSLCACGEGALANRCAPGNCRSDADCSGGFACETSLAGFRYCRSSLDRCSQTQGCDPIGAQGPPTQCDRQPGDGHWFCHLVPQIPPG